MRQAGTGALYLIHRDPSTKTFERPKSVGHLRLVSPLPDVAETPKDHPEETKGGDSASEWQSI